MKNIENSWIKIGFSYTDEFGNEFSQNSKIDVHVDIGETEYDVIGNQFNSFLRQCTFYRPNDYMLMDDVTEEEMHMLRSYLEDIRNDSDSDEPFDEDCK